MSPLTERRRAALAAADLTYPEAGATRGELPPGYHHTVRRELIGTGSTVRERAAASLFSWQMHRGAGLTLPPDAAPVRPGTVVVMRLGPPLVGVIAACRVVYIVDEPTRRGFAYGTLPHHPESGEEAFVLEQTSQDDVFLSIRAFWRPATRLARIGGPITRTLQRLVTDRYVHTLRRQASPDPRD